MRGTTGNLQSRKKQDPEKLAHINMAVQKKYQNLYRTSKSRFDGVNKYLRGAFLNKHLPVPSFQGAKRSVDHGNGAGDQNMAFNDDLARNNSSDLLMEHVGHQNAGRSETNLRKANIEMSQLLKDEINYSKETVERVKRGHSIFDLPIV